MTGSREAVDPTHRILTLLATLGLFGVSFATWATTVQVPFTGAVAVAGFAAGLIITVATVTATTEQRLRRLDYAVLALAMLLLVGWATSTLYFQPVYGTDEAAFEQYAAHAMLHGHNPYTVNLLPALNLYRVPIQYATYTMNGGVVASLGYPAFPVLYVAAFIPLTHGVQSVVVANVVAMLGAVVLAFFLLPKRLRPLSVLTIVGLPIIFGYTVAGVNAVIMMTLLLVVAHRWTQVGRSGRLSRSDVARAVCLGLALSVQQLAWFIAPFVVVGIYLLRRSQLPKRQATGLTLAWSAWAAAAFVLVNLPFVVWGPTAWLHGITAPLTQHAIPYGQGLVDVTLFFHLGGGAIELMTYAAGALLVGLFACYCVFFNRLGRAAFILPSLALFFPTRSLAEYFMTLVAVWVMAMATTSGADTAVVPQIAWPSEGPRHLRKVAPLVLVTAALTPASAIAAHALATPAPLALRIVSVSTTGQLQSVWRIDVSAVNRSPHPLRPHFATNYTGQASTFWNVLSGPATLSAGASAVYRLAAPNMGSMPGITTPFVLQAVTSDPETVSSTALFTPQPYSASLTPGYVNSILRSGDNITLRVQLRSPFGAIVRKAGVHVALGQLIYDQDNLIPAEATINGGPQGHSPATAVTDSTGVATFTITDTSPQDRPISFQAWIQEPRGYPFGYSQIVPVLWASRAG